MRELIERLADHDSAPSAICSDTFSIDGTTCAALTIHRRAEDARMRRARAPMCASTKLQMLHAERHADVGSVHQYMYVGIQKERQKGSRRARASLRVTERHGKECESFRREDGGVGIPTIVLYSCLRATPH